MTKDEVRARAVELGLRTADKPDSQDVCFITHAGGGRSTFLGARIPLRPGRLVDADGAEVGAVDAVELVTVGQRRGLGLGGDGEPRYAVSVDVPSATVVVGAADELMVDAESLTGIVWADDAARLDRARRRGGHRPGQRPRLADRRGRGRRGSGRRRHGLVVRWAEPQRRVAPGQSVVLYEGDTVLGGGTVTR